MDLLTSTHNAKISGVLSCYDRVLLCGTLPNICYSQGMTSYLHKSGVKIFDYARFVEPFRDEIRANAEQVAADHHLSIEFVSKSHLRKESLVEKVLAQRGDHPGMVHILSAMESCPSYKPWYDKRSGQSYLKVSQSKCLHYYFYFIDAYLGLCYFRVPTWCPFRLQVYFNGHSLLSRQLEEAGIGYSKVDNAFDHIEELPGGQPGWEAAQRLSDRIDIEELHDRLDAYAQQFCPVHHHFGQVYHWSIMQAEYATDIVFDKPSDLAGLYEDLVATAIHTVKPVDIATFLGRKLDNRYQGEMGNRYNIRIEGSRLKHTMGQQAIKMYDKFGKILRIETTTNEVSFFKHYRKVEHRDGTTSQQFTGLKRNIYSLRPLKDSPWAANRRYLEFISSIENKDAGRKRLEKVSQPKMKNNRNYTGFNFFSEKDTALLLALLRGEFNISGFQNKHIRCLLPGFSSAQVSRLLKRLHVHGLIKKARNTYKYYLTKLGKEVLITAEKIKQLVIIPALNY